MSRPVANLSSVQRAAYDDGSTRFVQETVRWIAQDHDEIVPSGAVGVEAQADAEVAICRRVRAGARECCVSGCASARRKAGRQTRGQAGAQTGVVM